LVLRFLPQHVVARLATLARVFAFAGVAVAVAFAIGSTASACAKTVDRGVLQELDFQTDEEDSEPFDKNTILESPALTDVDRLNVARVQAFLHKTPYKRRSFLETYQSNGIVASDAIIRAARTYRINPLVFLVEAEITQGLLGAKDYPFPPQRVEYVFRCGCDTDDTCERGYAGFDRQVDCLGLKLRAALDEVVKQKGTASGWAVDKPSVTLDGESVTPSNEATAALYDRHPRVAADHAGGTWLFWNVWNRYAKAIGYSSPSGGAVADGWIGDQCVSSSACGYEGAACATNYPDGLCTLPCKGDCPTDTNKAEAFCADFKALGGFCLPVCNPGASACRKGYECVRLPRFGAKNTADSKFVCRDPP
jgi:hypothetical protein